jgi:hypothetical protein
MIKANQLGFAFIYFDFLILCTSFTARPIIKYGSQSINSAKLISSATLKLNGSNTMQYNNQPSFTESQIPYCK